MTDEYGTIIVSLKLPVELTKGWTASQLERVLRQCAVFVGNAVALRYRIDKRNARLSICMDPKDPGIVVSWTVPLDKFAEVEQYTRQAWGEAVLEFA